MYNIIYFTLIEIDQGETEIDQGKKRNRPG